MNLHFDALIKRGAAWRRARFPSTPSEASPCASPAREDRNRVGDGSAVRELEVAVARVLRASAGPQAGVRYLQSRGWTPDAARAGLVRPPTFPQEP
jgi:hypothetical protein